MEVTLMKYAMIVFALLAYLIIIYGIIWKGKEMNAVTWVLWLILDGVALYGTIQKGEDATLLWIFIAGTGAVALLLLLKRHWAFGWIEIGTCFLVVICLVAMYFGDADQIIWAGSIAIAVAGIPFIKDLFKPDIDADTKQMCVLFFLTTGLSVARTAYLDQNMVFPVFCFIYWIFAMKMAYKEKLYVI